MSTYKLSHNEWDGWMDGNNVMVDRSRWMDGWMDGDAYETSRKRHIRASKQDKKGGAYAMPCNCNTSMYRVQFANAVKLQDGEREEGRRPNSWEK